MKQTGYKFKYKNIRVKDQAFIYIYIYNRATYECIWSSAENYCFIRSCVGIGYVSNEKSANDI